MDPHMLVHRIQDKVVSQPLLIHEGITASRIIRNDQKICSKCFIRKTSIVLSSGICVKNSGQRALPCTVYVCCSVVLTSEQFSVASV